MTAKPSGGSNQGRGRISRRRLVTGMAGALGATAAAAIAAAPPAEAATQPPALLSTDNIAPTGHRTAVFAPGGFEVASLGDSASTFPSTYLGVYGVGRTAGVRGDAAPSSNNAGVWANGDGFGPGVIGYGGPNGGYGVVGNGGDGASGVQGNTSGAAPAVTGQNSGAGPGVSGSSAGNDGVQGTAGSTGVGVRGTGGSAVGTAGVLGAGGASGGDGVQGFGTAEGNGVSGTGGPTNGIGVVGTAATAGGVGVLADNTAGGTALQVNGPAGFSRSGTVAIAYPAKSVTVTVPGGLAASALVLATVQNNVGVSVLAAVPSQSAGTVAITLNKAAGTAKAPKSATVAWFVVN